MPSHLEPLNNYIMVKRDDPKTTTEAGIVIAASAVDKPNMGLVMAISKGISLQLPSHVGGVFDEESQSLSLTLASKEPMLLPHAVVVGDRVLFNSYSGVEVKDPNTGGLVIFLKPADLIAVLRESSNERPDPDPQ